MCRTSITRWPEAARLATAAGALALLAACAGGGNEPPRTEQRGVDAFHSIDLRGAADMQVTVGGSTSVSVTAPPAVLDQVSTAVRNGVLVIEQHGGWITTGTRGPLELRIGLPSLNAVSINGAGNVKISGIAGAGLSLVLQGAGNLVATGTAPLLNARINGAGNMDLSGLEAIDATVAVYGAGSLSTRATGSLVAEVNGVGTIRYAGPPQKLDTRINGIGSITPVSGSGT